LLEGDERGEVWDFIEGRFGVPIDVRDRYTLWERGKTYWALSGSSSTMKSMASLKIISVGIPLVRKIRDQLKPTTGGLRLLSHWVTQNRIRLDETAASKLLHQGELLWTGEQSDGYVLLDTKEGVLGCGLLHRGRLRSQIPKSEVKAFLSSARSCSR
jgi:NOL1/NOP2/fmu family ribosome biogenesis protein